MSSNRKRILPSWMKQSNSSENVSVNKDRTDVFESPPAVPVKKPFIDTLSDTSDVDEANQCNSDEIHTTISVKKPVVDALSDTSDADEANQCHSVHVSSACNETAKTLERDLVTRRDSNDFTSNGHDSGAHSADDTGTSSQTDSSNLLSTSRRTCFYGSSCYRKNPQHRVEFSHPGDSDYPSQSKVSDDPVSSVDSRPLCEYGSACYRKNPQHRVDFRHDAPKKRKARPSKIEDLPSDNEGDFDGSISSDNFHPGNESDDSFITSDSVDTGNSETNSDYTDDEEKKKASKKKKKTKLGQKRKKKEIK